MRRILALFLALAGQRRGVRLAVAELFGHGCTQLIVQIEDGDLCTEAGETTRGGGAQT